MALELNWLGSDFDELRKASEEVIRALRGEALEERGLEFAGRAASSDRGESERRARLKREAAAVQWRKPPNSRKEASRRFLGKLLVHPRFWIAALLVSLPLLPLWFVAFNGDARWWGTGLLALALLLALVYGMATWKASELGREAFVESYARLRDLRREDPRLFQARHMGLNLTAVVDEALSGVPLGGRVGTLALLHGTGHDTDTEYKALIVPLDDRADESVVNSQLGRSGQMIRDGHLVSWMPLDDGELSIDSLDAFLEQTQRLYPTLLQI